VTERRSRVSGSTSALGVVPWRHGQGCLSDRDEANANAFEFAKVGEEVERASAEARCTSQNVPQGRSGRQATSVQSFAPAPLPGGF